MKKVLVGISALLVATGVAVSGDCTSGGKSCGCKPKKYRVIYVSAHNPETMYDNSMFTTTEVGPDYRVVPTERNAAMRDRGSSYSEDDKYYNDYNEPYDDEFYDERYTPDDKGSTGLAGGYVGGRVGVDLLTWKNKYKADPISAAVDLGADHDDFTLKPVFGGDVFIGLHLNPAVRMDVEVGYVGQFSESDNGISFKLSAPYATLNAYYDFVSGFYLGGGVGMAFPKITLDWEHFNAGSGAKTNTSFMGAFMLGYGHHLSDRVILDFRYRLSGFNGPKLTRGVSGFGTLNALETKTGFIFDNAFTVGIRYEF